MVRPPCEAVIRLIPSVGIGVFDVELDDLARLDALLTVAQERWAAFLADGASGQAESWMEDGFDAVFQAEDFEALEAALGR